MRLYRFTVDGIDACLYIKIAAHSWWERFCDRSACSWLAEPKTAQNKKFNKKYQTWLTLDGMEKFSDHILPWIDKKVCMETSILKNQTIVYQDQYQIIVEL